MKKKKVCRICHLIKSLVEEQTKHPYADGFVHRECYEKSFKKLRVKKPIGFDPTEGF